jgi:hypothetical protein
MIERRGSARLAVEPMEQFRISAEVQHLERHRPPEPRVAGAVDLAHAARPQAVDHFVGADARSGCEGLLHSRGGYHGGGAAEGPRSGQRTRMEEIVLYTVERGKIVREEFFYKTS